MSVKKELPSGHLIAMLVLLVPAIAWGGFVLANVWAMFVVPLGLPALSIWHAAGLHTVVSWLSGSASVILRLPDPDPDKQLQQFIAGGFVAPLLIWGGCALIALGL